MEDDMATPLCWAKGLEADLIMFSAGISACPDPSGEAGKAPGVVDQQQRCMFFCTCV